MKTLDLLPEQRRLMADVTVQKDLFLSLFIRLNDLTQTVKPNLESIYLVKIGSRELELFYQQVKVSGLKFKMELMIACLNAKQTFNMEEIEQNVQDKLNAYYNEINTRADKINQAQVHLASLMSPEETAEMKKLYYQAAKLLHPDVNPNLTDEQQQLWNMINFAYNNGDLQTVRNVAAAINGLQDLPEELSAYGTLQTQLEILNERNKNLLNKIETLQLEFPFTLIDKLNDEEWLESEYQRIETQIKEQTVLENKYSDYINLMLEV